MKPFNSEPEVTARKVFCRIVSDVPNIDRTQAVDLTAKALNRNRFDVALEIGISNIHDWQPRKKAARGDKS